MQWIKIRIKTLLRAGLRPNPFILIKEFWLAEVNQKSNNALNGGGSNIFFHFWFTWANHFIFDSVSFWFIFEAIESHWFILIRFDIDSSRITIHPRIMTHLRIKIKGRWILIHSFLMIRLIRFRIKSESKWIVSLRWKLVSPKKSTTGIPREPRG